MKYFVKTPWWLRRIYSSYLWNYPSRENKIYFTFDDGPHPEATSFVLEELQKHDAKGSFFCVGKNVEAHPDLYQRILDDGHTPGNHTYNHLNGWKTDNEVYLADINKASQLIHSNLFRPPYGRITSFQSKNLSKAMHDPSARIIMYDVLSGDFDTSISGEQCLQNVVLNARNGSIIVFHDSEKAFRILRYCLPRALDFFAQKGLKFERLPFTDKKSQNAEKVISINS